MISVIFQLNVLVHHVYHASETAGLNIICLKQAVSSKHVYSRACYCKVFYEVVQCALIG